MSDSDYTIRNYHASDFAGYFRLRTEAAKLDPRQGRLTPQSVRNSMGRPSFTPEQNLFLVVVSQEIIGYLDIRAESEIKRVILDCFIQPEHRRKGLARKLLTHAERRGKEVVAVVAHANVAENNTPPQKVLVKLGFQLIRREHELRLILDEATIGQGASSFPIRSLQPGEEDKLTEIQNRSFTGTWGYNPNTEEEIRYNISTGDTVPEEILLACDGDRPIAYCWTGVDSREGADMGEAIGRIGMIGVDPDYRGIGLGRAVLLAGLSYLKNSAVPTVILTVDSENEVAQALYRSVGFRLYDTTLWYEKTLD